MRDVMIALISYGTAINGALFGIWLAEKWPAPRLGHFALAGWLLVAMNFGVQVLSG